jgi:SAM-dependent methyltransferase
VAREFLRWLDVPPGVSWLDVGCGTGALTEAILTAAEPAQVVGVDPSAGFLEAARARVVDPRAAFQTGDAQWLPLPDHRFGAVVSGLALNFVPDVTRAVAELARVATVDGTVAAYVWDYSDGMAMMRHFWDAAAELDSAAGELDEVRRFPMCRPEPLRELWTAGGLHHVAVDAIDVDTTFTDFDDYWSPFLGGQGPAPSYVSSLGEDHRTRLRDLLHARLPVGPDGSIPLSARAWAVRGIAKAG